MKLSPAPVRPLLPSSLANWTAPRARPRWGWPLATLALLALLEEPQLSLAVAVGGGLFWWGRRRRPGASPTGWLVRTVGLTTAAMVGTYGLLSLLRTGDFSPIFPMVALAIALWQRGRPRRLTPKQAWRRAIAQLGHADDRVRAIALQRLHRWALRGLTPSETQELAGCCRRLLAGEPSPALREAVLSLAAAVDGKLVP